MTPHYPQDSATCATSVMNALLIGLLSCISLFGVNCATRISIRWDWDCGLCMCIAIRCPRTFSFPIFCLITFKLLKNLLCRIDIHYENSGENRRKLAALSSNFKVVLSAITLECINFIPILNSASSEKCVLLSVHLRQRRKTHQTWPSCKRTWFLNFMHSRRYSSG